MRVEIAVEMPEPRRAHRIRPRLSRIGQTERGGLRAARPGVFIPVRVSGKYPDAAGKSLPPAADSTATARGIAAAKGLSPWVGLRPVPAPSRGEPGWRLPQLRRPSDCR